MNPVMLDSDTSDKEAAVMRVALPDGRTMPVKRVPMVFRRLLGVWLILWIGCSVCTASDCPGAGEVLDLGDWSGVWEDAGSGNPFPESNVRFVHREDTPGRVALFPGSERSPGILSSKPLDLKSGETYTLCFELFRETFINGHYIEVKLFDEEFRIDNHCIVGGWQRFEVSAGVPDDSDEPVRIVFRNDTPSAFFMRNPMLVLKKGQETQPGRFVPPSARGLDRFPIGVYDGGPDDWDALRACGMNVSVVGSPIEKASDMLESAWKNGIKIILHCPHHEIGAAALAEAMEGLRPEVRPLFFYLMDEPELRSFSVDTLLSVKRTVRDRLPWAGFVTAMARSGQVPTYRDVYDAFFMDQYPVPTQPIGWLSDSISDARDAVAPQQQVWAVLQAFGGGKFARMGWQRRPTYEELLSLASSSLAKGVEGLLFYSWKYVRSDEAFRNDVRRVVERVRALEPGLPMTPGAGPSWNLELQGKVRTDVMGNPAVTVGRSVSKDGYPIVLLANITRYRVRFRLKGSENAPVEIYDIWRKSTSYSPDGDVRGTLYPLESRALEIRPVVKD